MPEEAKVQVIPALALWPGRDQQEDGSVILTKPQLQIYHVQVAYLPMEKLAASNTVTHCNLCSVELAGQQSASLAFTNAGNEIVCNNCATSLVSLGVSHNTYEAEEGQQP